MERKIGEIFECNDEFFQCVESSGCALCAFNETDCEDIDTGCCEVNTRSDRKSVIFKRLEKVGEPFMIGKVLYQHYKAFDIDNVCRRDGFWCIHNYKAKTLTIELTQNKEDMEENNNAKHSNTENIGKNFKAFDLQAAKLGKPVCTRDGRPARIICFDVKGDICPIIALVEKDNIEVTYHYDKNGQNAYSKSELDLMMLPEKKEGWVNVSKFSTYASKEEALSHKTYDIIDTIKVSWEE